MLKIRSFLHLIKDSIRNIVIKMIKTYNRHMATTAYALSAIVLVLYFGNLADFNVNPNGCIADAASYDVDKGSEETNSSENIDSDFKEYALNTPDHNNLLDLTTETEDEMTIQAKRAMLAEIYPLGQLSISPAVIHYSDVVNSMALLTTQHSLSLTNDASKAHLSLLNMDEKSISAVSMNDTKLPVADSNLQQTEANTKEDNQDKDKQAEKTVTKTDNKTKTVAKTDDKKTETVAKTDNKAKSDLAIPANLELVTNKKMMMKLSEDELQVLYRIVEAEATGEDIYGKILVANVVLNRVNDSEFPDTVSKVVFQKVGNSYQFSPTRDGRYYSVKITKSTKEAVKRALAGEDYSEGALYFFARKLTTEKKASWFDRNLRKVVQHGCHEFYANK